jgi:hypothetical protein
VTPGARAPLRRLAVQGYAIANILHVAAALDLARSTYRVLARSGQTWALRRAVLRRDVLEGYGILRLAEYPLFLAAPDMFRRAFEGVHCTGYAFDPVELA